MRDCWHWKPNDRLTFWDIVEKLENSVSPDFKLVSFIHSREGLEHRGYRIRCGERQIPDLLQPLELVQANKPDIGLLDHQQKTMFLRRRKSGPNILLVMVIGSLGGMRNTLLSALRAMPVCRAAAHILAARMQKAVILGSLRLLRAHDTRTQ
nr:unnamed protein product [Callosobruchus chinensis]